MSRSRENPRKILKIVFQIWPYFPRFFQNRVGGNFFENFSWVFPRSTHQDASIDLSFVWFCSVGATEKNVTQKNSSSGIQNCFIMFKNYFYFSVQNLIPQVLPNFLKNFWNFVKIEKIDIMKLGIFYWSHLDFQIIWDLPNNGQVNFYTKTAG